MIRWLLLGSLLLYWPSSYAQTTFTEKSQVTTQKKQKRLLKRKQQPKKNWRRYRCEVLQEKIVLLKKKLRQPHSLKRGERLRQKKVTLTRRYKYYCN